MSSNWSSGICGWAKCDNDCDICCMAWCFPCVTYANNEEKMAPVGDEHWWRDCIVYTGVLVCIGCPCFCFFGTRTRLRKKYDLPEEPCNDFCTHIWCHQCALCQEARELRRRIDDQPQAAAVPMQQMPPQAGYPPQGAYPPQAGYPSQGAYPPVPGVPITQVAPAQQQQFVK